MIDPHLILNLRLAIQITSIGMGLIFCAITLVWILITIIVNTSTHCTVSQKILRLPNEQSRELELKRRAAVAAVAIAISQEHQETPHEFPLPATALVSAWQAVMRTEMLLKSGKRR